MSLQGLNPPKMANDDLVGNRHKSMMISFRVTMETSQAAIFLVVFGPNKLGTKMYLNIVLRYIGDTMDACPIYKEGVVTT